MIRAARTLPALLPALPLLLLSLGACGDDGAAPPGPALPVVVQVLVPCPQCVDEDAATTTGTDDAWVALGDTLDSPDAGPADEADGTTGPQDSVGHDDAGRTEEDAVPTGDVALVDDADDAVVEDDAVDSGPPPGPSGETDGPALIVDPDALDGLFLYGVNVEPGSPLGTIGSTAIGVLVIPAVVELDDGELHIRVYDTEAQEVIQGPSGVIEAYAYEALDDGRVRVDFDGPIAGLEIQFWRSCVYTMQGYTLFQNPVYEAGLLTWIATELYGSESCGNAGLDSSLGLNAHFLRRADIDTGFVPRAVDPESPFGFFAAEQGDEPYMTRLAQVGPDFDDGQVPYLLSVDFPEHLRPVVHDVFEDWNDVLEGAGANRPFVVSDAPPDVVAWDPRHRVVLWDPSKTQGAIAPFLDDPLSGEMFDSDIIVWLGELDDLLEKYGEFFDDNPEVAGWLGGGGDEVGWALPPDWNDDAELPPNVLRRRARPSRPFSMAQVAQLQRDIGMSFDAAELEALIIADFLTHEVGHNLGLRHNFKGSIDRDHHPADETATTTMDYVVGMVRPGTYDQDAMRHAYGGGALDTGYLYCTDEHVDLDPGCARWDYGHPVAHYFALMDGLTEDHPASTSDDEIEAIAEEQEWNNLFRRLRQFVNSDYEAWDPEAPPVLAFDELLSRVVCEPACALHPYFRDVFALYLLFTKYVALDAWQDFPPLDAAQATTLLDAYYVLILDPAQPLRLKETIIGKLPSSGVPGAPELLDDLFDYLNGLADPTELDETLLSLIVEAKAS